MAWDGLGVVSYWLVIYYNTLKWYLSAIIKHLSNLFIYSNYMHIYCITADTQVKGDIIVFLKFIGYFNTCAWL